MRHEVDKRGENSQPNDSFFSRIYNFINQELTISEFEGANTYCNELFQLTSMDFRVDNPKIPYNIRGYVQYKGDWIPSTWNSHGKCSCPKLGKDQSQYNLKRKRRKATISLTVILLSAGIGLVTLFFYWLLSSKL